MSNNFVLTVGSRTSDEEFIAPKFARRFAEFNDLMDCDSIEETKEDRIDSGIYLPKKKRMKNENTPELESKSAD